LVEELTVRSPHREKPGIEVRHPLVGEGTLEMGDGVLQVGTVRPKQLHGARQAMNNGEILEWLAPHEDRRIRVDESLYERRP
jgi:hypothetical protein